MPSILEYCNSNQYPVSSCNILSPLKVKDAKWEGNRFVSFKAKATCEFSMVKPWFRQCGYNLSVLLFELLYRWWLKDLMFIQWTFIVGEGFVWTEHVDLSVRRDAITTWHSTCQLGQRNWGYYKRKMEAQCEHFTMLTTQFVAIQYNLDTASRNHRCECK